MRGKQNKQQSMLGLINPSDRIPKDHPLRRIKSLADEILRQMGPTFNAMYSKTGRPSIPPEQLLKGSLLMALYTIRSERQFCEQLNYNLPDQNSEIGRRLGPRKGGKEPATRPGEN